MLSIIRYSLRFVYRLKLLKLLIYKLRLRTLRIARIVSLPLIKVTIRVIIREISAIVVSKLVAI